MPGQEHSRRAQAANLGCGGRDGARAVVVEQGLWSLGFRTSGFAGGAGGFELSEGVLKVFVGDFSDWLLLSLSDS